ncbi:lymphocyte antigen 86-like [Ictalurus punctatus]|uniref:Lymphocyte antigen 86-like n=1 Tax=Ictalurus punctatus TaxID=7998 RepID=A0A9F7RAN5_ICTPU|nr:lymphocyte antigen 86-like [Ictalurus punctatus]
MSVWVFFGFSMFQTQTGQSIDELYISVVVFHNGLNVFHMDEPICLPNFPRFTFCGNRRGEMVTIRTSLPGLKYPLKGSYNIHVHGINQNGFQIGCVNASAKFPDIYKRMNS